MRRTVVARTSQEISRLRYAWDKLASQSSATMFQSFQWNHVAATAFAEREAPVVIYSENDNGAALIPAALTGNGLGLIGETLFDYRDVLCVGDEHVLHCAWQRASQLGHGLSTGAVRNDSNLAAWTGFNLTRFYSAPCVSPREISADDFSSRHGRLGRWFRRLQREGVEFRCHTGLASELVRFIYEQKRNQPSDTGDNLFSDPRRVDFMVELCRKLGSTCEIFTFETAAEVVAALVTFRDRNFRRFYTTYFDQRWKQYSPGMVMLYELTRRTLHAGLTCDYMTGEHGYKLRFSTSVVPMFWADASASTLASLGEFAPVVAA